MNYDIYKKIGDYDVAKQKSTEKTYYEGRSKSAEIQEIQNNDKRREYAERLKIKQIDIEFKKGTGEINATRATSSVPVETTFAGKSAEDITRNQSL